MSLLTEVNALCESAESSARLGSGLSFELYEKRVQGAYQSILDKASESDRAETAELLLARGFDPDYQPYQAQPGECDLTGIDENCCPCGQHP